MPASENKILQKLTGSDADINKLQQIAKRYPYFGVAYYFLARQAAIKNANEYQPLIQKAALHFDNTLWLKHNFDRSEPSFDADKTQHESIAVSDEFFLKEDAVLHEVKEPSSQEVVLHDNNISIDVNHNIAEHTSLDIQHKAETKEEEVNETSDALIAGRLSHILQQQTAEMNKPVDEEAHLPIEIQQHYQSDYFASQGIRLDNEKDGNDQFGAKLKKFTDWLRQMKRINPNPINLGTDEQAEQYIQQIADSSNKAKEVVTETMAEVLVKQQKNQQAIDVYKKLSLSDPSKEAYFAAKIEEVKNLS